YWTCDAECRAKERACPWSGHIAGGEGDTPQGAGAAAIQNCHASLLDQTYCTVDPYRDTVSYCELADHPPPPWFCSATCYVSRTSAPPFCPPDPLWASGSGPPEGAARRSRIAAGTSAAWLGCCELAPDPNDTPADSPDNVIDDVTVTCQYHPYGGGGGGGGG